MLYCDFSTEDKIERAVERQTDRIDYAFTTHLIDRAEYDKQTEELRQSAEAAYRAIPRKS